MKFCYKCKQEKELDAFASNKHKKDGKSPQCRECQKEYRRNHYLNHYPIYRKNIRDNKDKVKNLILENKKSGCIKCGEDHPSCLDFHHLENKEFNVGGSYNNKGYQQVKNEIKKCIILCANCHRKLHN